MLIESGLGLTASDHEFLQQLERLGRPFHAVLTKADLLAPLQLAQSCTLVRAELERRYSNYGGGDVPMCSAKNGTGVTELWARLAGGVEPQGILGQKAVDAVEHPLVSRMTARALLDRLQRHPVRADETRSVNSAN